MASFDFASLTLRYAQDERLRNEPFHSTLCRLQADIRHSGESRNPGEEAVAGESPYLPNGIHLARNVHQEPFSRCANTTFSHCLFSVL